ncbi:MAG TPA: hypothetical protein VJL90_06270, partial [Pseudorhodoplanes sp.]|nr:hypothetical protein [Pseudorhodoplanes sp.]
PERPHRDSIRLKKQAKQKMNESANAQSTCSSRGASPWSIDPQAVYDTATILLAATLTTARIDFGHGQETIS